MAATTRTNAAKKLFRREPPRELVDEVLRACGLRAGIADLRWFTRDELVLTGAEEWLMALEPYYLPCKARRFLHAEELSGARAVTVLRHILEPHGYGLVSQERLYAGAKQALYQIQPTNSFKDLSGVSLTVEFV